MTADDAVIRTLVSRIQDLEQRMDELQRHQVSWRIRGVPVQGAYNPRQLPDWPGLRISQPLETRRP
jgi:hypothetical protein